jgi:hypothetical protein
MLCRRRLCVSGARHSSVEAWHQLQSVAIQNSIEWHQKEWEARSSIRRTGTETKLRQYHRDTAVTSLFGLLGGYCSHRSAARGTTYRVSVGGGRRVCLQRDHSSSSQRVRARQPEFHECVRCVCHTFQAIAMVDPSDWLDSIEPSIDIP